MNTDLTPACESFLRKLGYGLSSLPVAEQQEILAEIRSHLVSRQSAGSTELLAGFESPEELAAEFVAERALRGALAQGTPWSAGHALLIATRDSVPVLAGLVPLIIVQLVAIFLVIAAALKPVLGSKLGLWVGEGNFYVGRSNGSGVHELLGWWGIPVFAASGIVLFWLSSRALRGLVRWRLQLLQKARR